MKYWIPCQLSVEGERTLKADYRRVNGHIVGESLDKKCWLVTWNNKLKVNGSGGTIAKRFITIIKKI